MSDQLQTVDNANILERVVVGGDLSGLTPRERLTYYKAVCESVGLNPLTKPFEYITLNGKLTLYARRDCTDQLRAIHGVSIQKLERDRYGTDLYVVTAYAQDRTGRTDAATGAVATINLKGDALANAIMKAETKAKRRVTLSLCGLGLLDETEIETIPDAKVGEPTKVTNGADVPPAPAVQVGTEAPERPAAPPADDVPFAYQDEPETLGAELVALWRKMKATKGWVKVELRDAHLPQSLADPNPDWSLADVGALRELLAKMRKEAAR